MCFCLPRTDKKWRSCGKNKTWRSCGKNKTASGSDMYIQHPNTCDVGWPGDAVDRSFFVGHFLEHLIYLHWLNRASQLKNKISDSHSDTFKAKEAHSFPSADDG